MERFDVVDIDGQLTGETIERGQPFPKDRYHHVVQIFTFNANKEVLITKRHPDKPYGNLWEITAGSVIAGESVTDGAVRELAEETGIRITPDQLIPIIRTVHHETIWFSFMVVLEASDVPVTYQDLETIDHRWIDVKEFKRLFVDDAFPGPMKHRLLDQWSAFTQALQTHVQIVI
jgi:8-oxo-dGTP pyrophosphatase MutT (NUDIX family)